MPTPTGTGTLPRVTPRTSSARSGSENVGRSRQCVSEALAEGDMGQLAKRTNKDGGSPSMRWIVTHMIEEYARHNGHADLIRESVDGQTGE